MHVVTEIESITKLLHRVVFVNPYSITDKVSHNTVTHLRFVHDILYASKRKIHEKSLHVRRHTR